LNLSTGRLGQLNISEPEDKLDNFICPVSRKYGHLLPLDLPESKITTTTTDKDIFKYLSLIRSDFGFEVVK